MSPLSGYTKSMKTAISIPDVIFAEAVELARRLSTSRSELYSRAVREYVARHSADQVTEKLDLLVEEGCIDSSFATAAARQTLERSEW